MMKNWLWVSLIMLTGCFSRDRLGLSTAQQITPQVLPADGNAYATVAVMVIAAGDPMPSSDTLTLHSSDPNAQIVQFGPADPNGWSYARISSRVPGTQSLTVTVSDSTITTALPFTGFVTFNPVIPIVPPRSSLVVSPNAGVQADGNSKATITFTLRDASGNPVSGVRVTLRAENVGTFAFMVSGITDPNGQVTAPLSSTFAGPKNVVARAAGQTWTATASFDAPAGACVGNPFLGTPPLWRNFLGGISSAHMVVSDVDHDGKLDVIDGTFHNFTVTRGDGKGGPMGAPGYYPPGVGTAGFDVCDLNGDTYPDAVVFDANSKAVSVWLNGAAGGTCAPAWFGPWPDPYDYNTVVSESGTQYAATRLTSSEPLTHSGAGGDWTAIGTCSGNAAGAFSLQGNYALPLAVSGTLTYCPALGACPVDRILRCVDVTGDGNADVVGISNANSTLVVLPGSGTGSFGAPTTFSLPATPYALNLGDLDHDGDLDVVYSGHNGLLYRTLNNGSGGFGGVTSYGVDPNVLAIVLYDVTQDGNLDVMTVNEGSNSFSLLAGNGNGGFAIATTVPLPFGPKLLTLGDFNADGNTDYFATAQADFGYAGLGKGGGVFNNPNQYHVTAYPTDLAFNDMNGDGKSDIVVRGAGEDVGEVLVLLGRSDGSFADYSDYNASAAGYLAGADIDRDGDLDLVTAARGGSDVQVLLNGGTGAFGSPIDYSLGSEQVAGRVTLLDIDLDGAFDLLVPTSDANGVVAVMLNQGAGIFGAPTPLMVGLAPQFVLSADFNGDGLYDIEATGASKVAVLLATAPGVFAAPVTYMTGGTDVGNAAAVDLNGDGYTDLMVGAVDASHDGALTTLINDGNGHFTGGSALYLPNPVVQDFVPGYVGAADLDLDGNTDACMVDWVGDDSQVKVLRGAGTGAFVADRSYYVPDAEGYVDVTMVDINGDGYPDAATSAWNSYTTSFFLGGGTLSMESVKHYLAPYVYALNYDGGIVVGDFNNDGHADFARTQTIGGVSTVAVRLYIGCP